MMVPGTCGLDGLKYAGFGGGSRGVRVGRERACAWCAGVLGKNVFGQKVCRLGGCLCGSSPRTFLPLVLVRACRVLYEAVAGRPSILQERSAECCSRRRQLGCYLVDVVQHLGYWFPSCRFRRRFLIPGSARAVKCRTGVGQKV